MKDPNDFMLTESEGEQLRKAQGRIATLEAALRRISDVGHKHRDPYVEGSWFAAVADQALGHTSEYEVTK